MTYLVSAYLLWVIVCFGLGALSGKVLRLDGDTNRLNPFQNTWLGYVTLTALLQLLSIVLPLREAAVIPVIIAGTAGAVYGLIQVGRFGEKGCLGRSFGIFLLVAVFIGLIAFHGDVQRYDTGLYHLMTVLWNGQFAVVPGLGNLHDRLAFNSSFHLFAAATEVLLWNDLSPRIAVAFLTILSLAQWVFELSSGTRRPWSSGFLIMSLPFLMAGYITNELPSLSTDQPIQILTLVVFYETLRFIESYEQKQRSETLHKYIIYLSALSTVLVTVKLSGVGIVFGIWLLLAWMWWSRTDKEIKYYPALFIPAVLCIGLFIRQAYLSGWLLYPLPWGKLPLSWTIPHDAVLEGVQSIQSWARAPKMPPKLMGQVGFWGWFPGWLDMWRGENSAANLLLCVLLFPIVIFAAVREQHARAVSCLLCAVAVIPLVAWFLSAPDFRFASGIVYGSVILLGLIPFRNAPWLKAIHPSLISALALLVFCRFFTPVWFNFTPDCLSERPSPSQTTSAPVDLEPFLVTDTLGKKVDAYSPRNDDRCWRGPLLCTPRKTGFVVVDGDNLGKGFRGIPKQK